MSVTNMEKSIPEGLPPRDISRRLMRMPVGKRMETILSSSDSSGMAASLAVQDFYVTVQEIGPDDSLPLLALATVPQLTHLFDIEWWEKDKVRPAAALGWLERLALASEEKMAAWLYEADFELLVTLFKRWLVLAVVPEDTDLLEARESLPKQSLDSHYFWDVKYPQYEDLVKRVLSFLFEVNYGFYRELMSQIIWTLDAEVEEQAYRFHKGRLEDRAIPDFYEAVTIYHDAGADGAAFPGRVSMAEQGEEWPPGFAVAHIQDRDFLGSVLRESPGPALLDSIQDSIQFELASLANKVVVADGSLPEGSEALRRAVEKTVAYVSLGLELRSDGDIEAARRAIQDCYLEDLFRLAHNSVAKIRGRLQTLQRRGWLSLWSTGIRVLDGQWLERAELLLEKTPRWLRSSGDTTGVWREDFFKSRRDLLEGSRLMDVIEEAGQLYHSVRVDPEVLARDLWRGGQIPDIESVTLGSLVWTAAARQILHGRWAVAPLPVKDWNFISPALGPAVMREVILAHTAMIAPAEEKRALLMAYLEPVFQTYEEDLSHIQAGAPPEPALVRYFLFSRK